MTNHNTVGEAHVTTETVYQVQVKDAKTGRWGTNTAAGDFTDIRKAKRYVVGARKHSASWGHDPANTRLAVVTRVVTKQIIDF